MYTVAFIGIGKGLRMAEYKKEIATAVGVAIVLAVLIGGAAVYFFPGRISGSFGGPRLVHAIYPTALTCSIQNGSCRIVISNNETSSAQAVGCEFQSIYAINGNNQSLTTINDGAGVLSNKAGGPAMSITISTDTSATVYCTNTQPSTLKTGSPADGEVLFSNQSLDVQFLGNWH